jgi:hypothetical protein
MRKQKYEVIWLDRCEVGFRDKRGELQKCNKPAIAIMVFDNGDECTCVCEEHLKEIEKDILESEDE